MTTKTSSANGTAQHVITKPPFTLALLHPKYWGVWFGFGLLALIVNVLPYRLLLILGRFYAAALADSGIEFDVLFGPAYKGIPIATTTAVALADHHDVDTPYCFNRKEAKNHGEGGNLVGSELEGRIMLVDDVITAGTAIRESMEIIQANGADLAGVLVAIDRQEKGKGELSAIQEVERDFGCAIISIVSLTDLVTFLEEKGTDAAHLESVKAYRAQYGI